MRYGLLGRSGLRVSELCLGTMTFGGPAAWHADDTASRAVFDAFAEAGGTFIDTANAYGGGASERLVGEFVRSDRDRFVVATKYTQGPHVSSSGNSRRNMINSVEQSLRRMKLEAIDVFWLHLWDFTTPVDELMRAFEDLVSSGKVHYIGASDTPAWEVSRANMLADLRGWAPYVGLQIDYSLLERTAERDLLPMAEALDIGVTAWSPLAGGLLARPWSPDATSARAAAGRSRAPDDQAQATIRAVMEIAADVGRPPAQVALAWIRSRPQLPPIIPILGARTAEQLIDALGCVDLELPVEAIERLDAVSRIELGFPHAMIARSQVRALVTGGMDDLLDNHRY
jgi:aryl-alcohol dehydrogenase-like predicted oxidoreductase